MHPFSYRDDPNVPRFADDRALIVIDGDCALCAADARFMIQRDKRRRIRIATAQSPLGQALYRHYGLGYGADGTFLLIADGHVYTRADAALRVLSLLKLPWPLLGAIARLAPTSWADALYRLIARKRYRWFGHNEVCYTPSPEDADRFLS